MRRLPIFIPHFTILFFFFSLIGNTIIADPSFTSFAFAQSKADGKIKLKKGAKNNRKSKNDGDKDKDNNSSGKGSGLRQAVTALQGQANDLQNQINTIELTPGPQGPQGDPGPQGIQGIQGPQGPAGAKGDQGIQGIQGIPGAPGADGANGTNGIDGAPGPQGIQGVPGPAGPPGADSTVAGPQGPKGDTGATGPAGPTGPAGAPGADSTVAGPQGPTGPAGPSGAEISGRLAPCVPTGGLGMTAYIPGRSFFVRLPFDGSFVFSHVPAGTHTIVFELNGNVIGTIPNVVAVEGQTTDVGVFVTAFCQSDADGDGFNGPQGDCNNNDANINPGAAEVCDGIDNNCDTQIDENNVCAPAPVDCQMSEWSAWSACSESCGGGTQTRTRTITVQPENGGAACGATTETRACNTHVCITKTVFLTSKVYTGNLGGLTGADAKCQELADSPGSLAPLGRYLAWLSDDTNSPNTRFNRNPGPYVNVLGERIADDYTHLVGVNALENPDPLTHVYLHLPIRVDERGTNEGVKAGSTTWTSTDPTGDRHRLSLDTDTCSSWQSQSMSKNEVMSGNAFSTHEGWTGGVFSKDCAIQRHLYCFEQ